MPENDNLIVNRAVGGRGRYTLDGRPLTGVTTICNMQSKQFLIMWAASEAYKDAVNLSKEEIKEVIKTKKYAHTRKSDSAKDKGSQAHDYVEMFVKNYIETKQYQTQIIDDEEVRNSVERFYDWAVKNNVEFIGSEVSVYSRKHWYGGSFDFICKINGKLLLGDFKSSKSIDDTYFAQCAGYIIAVEEHNNDIVFDGAVIVRSTLAKESQVWYEKSSTGSMKKMENLPFEVKYNFNLTREKTYFLSLLNIYKYSKGQEISKWYEAPTVEYTDEDYPVNS